MVYTDWPLIIIDFGLFCISFWLVTGLLIMNESVKSKSKKLAEPKTATYQEEL